MRIGYFDCFSGAAGDMILAALIHAGCPLPALQDVVKRLRLPGVTLRAQRVQQGGLAATRVRVEPGSPKSHRHLPEILSIISAADLSTRVTERATAVFKRLAEAEAAVHGTSVDAIHFHEVGAADAIVDIVGACAGLQLLELDRIVCSPIPTGYGTVTCDHGVMPVPAPATAELLKGVPLADCDEPMELTTPTGAAILTTLASDFGPLPPMRIASVGYGAGSRVSKTRPNILRLLVGEATDATAAEHDQVVVLEAAVDDATGQAVAYACERLLAAGALDAHIVPIIMKKGRAGPGVDRLVSSPRRRIARTHPVRRDHHARRPTPSGPADQAGPRNRDGRNPLRTDSRQNRPPRRPARQRLAGIRRLRGGRAALRRAPPGGSAGGSAEPGPG